MVDLIIKQDGKILFANSYQTIPRIGEKILLGSPILQPQPTAYIVVDILHAVGRGQTVVCVSPYPAIEGKI